MEKTYGKWDSPEEIELAFENVKYEKWDLKRFSEWVEQVKVEEYRNATADESM